VVNPLFPAKTVPEFIAYARANPGKINIAHSGVGSQPHICGELFKMMAGVDLVGVPYRGQPEALTNLLGGQVQVTFDPLANSIGHVRAGRLRALGVTTAMRSPELPEVPAIGEFVPGYEASGWQGIGAPRDTPPEVIDILNKEINAGLADTKMKARFADAGGYTPFPSSRVLPRASAVSASEGQRASPVVLSPGELDHPAAHTSIASFGKPSLASLVAALVWCTC